MVRNSLRRGSAAPPGVFRPGPPRNRLLPRVWTGQREGAPSLPLCVSSSRVSLLSYLKWQKRSLIRNWISCYFFRAQTKCLLSNNKIRNAKSWHNLITNHSFIKQGCTVNIAHRAFLRHQGFGLISAPFFDFSQTLLELPQFPVVRWRLQVGAHQPRL